MPIWQHLLLSGINCYHLHQLAGTTSNSCKPWSIWLMSVRSITCWLTELVGPVILETWDSWRLQACLKYQQCMEQLWTLTRIIYGTFSFWLTLCLIFWYPVYQNESFPKIKVIQKQWTHARECVPKSLKTCKRLLTVLVTCGMYWLIHQIMTDFSLETALTFLHISSEY